jgi:predicted TIM-barrel enzyme
VAAPASSGAYGRGQSPGVVSKDEYWANKEARDIAKEERFTAVSEPRMALSVAVQAAADIVVAAIGKDVLSFGNASKAKRLDMLADFTKQVAKDLAKFIHNAPAVLAEANQSHASSSDDTFSIEDTDNNNE